MSVQNTSDMACLKAALSLHKTTGDSQFVQLGKKISGRPLAFPRGLFVSTEDKTKAISMVDSIFKINPGDEEMDFALDDARKIAYACKTLWSDASFIKPDPEIIFMLANSSCQIKRKIPEFYYRAVIVAFSSLVREHPILEYRKLVETDEGDDNDDVSHWDIVDELIDAAFEKAQEYLGTSSSSSQGIITCQSSNQLEASHQYILGGKIASEILDNTQKAMDQVNEDAEKMLDFQKQALDALDAALDDGLDCSDESMEQFFGESAEAPLGTDGSQSHMSDADRFHLRGVCDFYVEQCRSSIETVASGYRSLSMFVKGSIDILKGQGQGQEQGQDDW